MKKIHLLFTVIFSTIIFSGCTLPFQPQKKSGIQVTTKNEEKATVFLDGNHIGNTPLINSDVKAGTYSLKLVPEDTAKQPYVTTVTLIPGSITAVNWTFGNTAEESGGEVFELSEITDKKKAQLSLITVPDNVIVKIDGQSKGFSPMTLDDVAEGSHSLTVVAPGYNEMTSNPKITKGYKLTVTLKMIREPLIPSQTPSPTPNPEVNGSSLATQSAMTQSATNSATTSSENSGITTTTTTTMPYVKILDNPLGWLRVRAEANSSSAELTKLSVGSTVSYLDSVSGWYKVEYSKGKQGWISSQAQYVKLIQ